MVPETLVYLGFLLRSAQGLTFLKSRHIRGFHWIEGLPMVDSILFPAKNELEALSHRVGGLVKACYSFPAKDEAAVRKMAIQIATGQTIGFLPDDLPIYELHVGRVVNIEFLGDRGRTTIVFPAQLFGNDISGMLTVLFGKISFAPGLRLESVDADSNFLNLIKGPRHGLSGIRTIVGKQNSKKPLLMAILKPGLGPSDDKLAEQFGKLVQAGTDLVKDDETRIDLTLDQALVRLEKVLSSGKGKGVYVTHLSGPAFELKQRALKLQSSGAQAFLFCPYTYGLSLLQSLCSDPEIKVPLFAHPAFTGVMSHGSSAVSPSVLLGTLMRWSGCDAVLFPSPYGSISLPKSEAIQVHESLVRPEGQLKAVASVPSAGIMPEFVSRIREDFGSDVVVNAGTGMARTGSGVEEGAKAFQREIDIHFS